MKVKNKINDIFSTCWLLLVLFSASMIAHAAPGDLDHSFNAGTFTNFTGSGLNIRTMAIQTDGKIIIGGVFEKINGITSWSIARLNPDGSLDPSFSSPFIYTVTQTQVSDLLILPDGKILVNGSLITPGGTKRVVRLNQDGSIDPSFSADPAYGGGSDFALLPSGAILVTGNGTVSVLDGGTGALVSHAVTFTTAVSGLIALSENQFAVADRYSSDFSFVRAYLTNGQQDPGFRASTAVGRLDGLELQPDGRILACGQFTQFDSLPKSGVVRLSSNGFIDPSFTAPISLGYVAETKSQPDGKIIIGGRFFLSGNPTPYAVARLNADGSLDSSFTRTADDNAGFYSVDLQADGRTLIGGAFSNVNGVPRQLIARLSADGAVNAPPILSDLSATVSIDENGVAAINGNISDPNPTDAFSLTVDWGDGSAPQVFNYPAGTAAFSQTHQYLDDNPTGSPSDNYTISLTLSDGAGGSDTDSATVTVNNAAPVLTGISASPSVFTVGSSMTLSGSVSDAGTLDTQQIVINWGDGSADTVIYLAAGVTSFSAAHQYNTSGAFSIGITATDDDAGTSSGSSNVTVNPAPPAPPAAPTNLRLTVISASQINLAWTDNSNNETGFLIERCSGGKCTAFAQIGQSTANVTVFSNTALTTATSYSYRVRAFNADGNSAYSNTAKGKTLRR